MRRRFALMIVLLFSLLLLVGCKSNQRNLKNFEFEMNSDSSSYTLVKYRGRSKEVNIPSEYKDLPVTKIKNSCFYGCTSLKQVTIPNSIISIGDHAFYNCTSLESVTIPSSLKSVDDRAFQQCDSLNRVDISDLEAWCNIVFKRCSSSPRCFYFKHSK